MKKDDDTFLRQVTDPDARAEAVRRWRLSRTLSFTAFLIFFCAAVFSIHGNSGAMCGLFAGVGALQFAVAISTDTKIKVALLVDTLEGR